MNGGCVHLFSIPVSERYSVFFMALSKRYEKFDFVYFLVFPFGFSMKFVVWIF